MRRRLWHHLRLLDLFCAFDRGSEPLIRPSSYATPLPLNVNDCDFNETSTDLIEPQQAMLTEMTFGRLAFDAIDVWQQLATSDIPPSHDDIRQPRLQLVWNHGQHARQNYLRLCDLSDPFYRFIRTVCRFTVCSLMLQAVRPEQDYSSAIPPRADNPKVLRIAVNCLKIGEEMQTDPESEKWRWMVWLQWRALVVALAGLCGIRDTPLASEAWVWVEAAYARYPGSIADASSGMFWRPLVRLYQRAKMFKEHAAPLMDAAFPPQSVQPPSHSNATEMDV